MSLSLTIFRDFVEDKRTSMDICADALLQGLQTHYRQQCHVQAYTPTPLPYALARLGNEALRMRLSRYIAYPWQVRRYQGQINHIIDHGYGHLLYSLDSSRTIVTVHDIFPLLWWKGCIAGLPKRPKPWLNLFSFGALHRARHLIAISESTRHDLIEHCGCRPDQITVVYDGVDAQFTQLQPDHLQTFRLKWNLPADGTQYILVSGSHAYKNLTGSLRAFKHLLQNYTGKLLLLKTGFATPEWHDQVAQLQISEYVRTLGFLQHDELPALYNIVDVLLFPSFYEGFGLPPLEAMACGTPVVVSQRASLPEVVGDAGLLVDPLDSNNIAQVLYRVLTDNKQRQTMIERGLQQARQFSWKRTVQETWDVYQKVKDFSFS